MWQSDQDTGTISSVLLATAGTTVCHSLKHLNGIIDGLAFVIARKLSDKPNTARVTLERGVVESNAAVRELRERLDHLGFARRRAGRPRGDTLLGALHAAEEPGAREGHTAVGLPCGAIRRRHGAAAPGQTACAHRRRLQSRPLRRRHG
uniref:Similar to GLT1 (NADH-dependent glutamate synthase 1 gene) n=1 Tax=Arundo donax TaxID=35708 RepID=A0A0A9DP87_ARUDO